MKLSAKLLKALNKQINMELASGYLYRAMSHDMKNLALNGYAKWLDKQYEEEREHAFKILQWFITEQIEEEVNARDNVAGFEKAKDCEGLLFMFDAHLGGR